MSPQLWTSFADSMWSEAPDLLVMLRRLDDPSAPSEGTAKPRIGHDTTAPGSPQPRASHRPRASTSAYNTSPIPPNGAPPSSPSLALAPLATVTTPLEGEVGACCDDKKPSGVSAPPCGKLASAKCAGDASMFVKPILDKRFDSRASAPWVQSEAPRCPGPAAGNPGRSKIYDRIYHDKRFDRRAAAPCVERPRGGAARAAYGLVVQSRLLPSVSGCYLLTTFRTDACSACSCTRFTLARADSSGVSVSQQMADLWLSGPAMAAAA